ncbi:hypothetical protein BGZ76_006472 [Entomortierella beljakovae]|nr:hypothetical protein BGZ76_006472 [Entomortierella beljakovae]
MLMAMLPNTMAKKSESTADSNISIAEISTKDNVYSWELDSFPVKSISQLEEPFQLEKALSPGESPFDIISDPDPESDENKTVRVLRSIYPAGSYARSGDKHAEFTSTPLPVEAFTSKKNRYIRLEYQLYFEPGFDWVQGGKLPGILLGSESGCNAGCSGGGTAESCFSTRLMWRAEGKGELYLYAAKSVYFPDEDSTCKRSLDKKSPENLFALEQMWLNADRIPDEEEEKALLASKPHTLGKREDDSCLSGMKVTISKGASNLCNPNYGISIGRGGEFQFSSGTWHNVTQLVRVNSKGNAVKDGYLSVYLDGKSVIQADSLVLLKKGYNPSSIKSDDAKLVKFMFSSFFGGGSSKYATPNKQWITWKGFKMATSEANIWE